MKTQTETASRLAEKLLLVPGLCEGIKAKDAQAKFGCTLPVAYNAIRMARWWLHGVVKNPSTGKERAG